MIYLDNAATTQPLPDVLKKAEKFNGECFFNPSALYRGGLDNNKEISEAREFILKSLGADAKEFECVFTSCGSESDNQAIFSCAKRGIAVTTAGEHAAVHRSFAELKNRGVETRFVSLEKNGAVNTRELLEIAAAEIPNFAGLKYTDENLFEYCTCLDYSDRFQILYGRDEMLLGALAMGAEAAVGSTYNYLPRLYHEMIAAFRGGDHRRAHELQALTHASVRLLGKYGPQSSKLFMKAAGLEIGFARLPALRLPREQGNAFYRDVEAAGLLPWLG